jgi:hypothetical protein
LGRAEDPESKCWNYKIQITVEKLYVTLGRQMISEENSNVITKK